MGTTIPSNDVPRKSRFLAAYTKMKAMYPTVRISSLRRRESRPTLIDWYNGDVTHLEGSLSKGRGELPLNSLGRLTK